MRREIFSVSISDQQTRDVMRNAYKDYQLILEPHGAVGWAGLAAYLDRNPLDNKAEQLCVSLETAHPAKFPEEIIRLTGLEPPLPKSLEGLEGKPEFVTALQLDYQDFKKFLLDTF
jgi:threonine synthase